MADTEMPGSGQETGSAVALQVVEALRSPGGGVGALRSLLAETSLSEQHRDVLALLEILDAAEEGLATDADLDALIYQQDPDAAELQACREEVADLREVNDVTAAALGACRICWGGNRSCPVCGGQGRPGANLPDLRLYNELVRPAIERMSAGQGLQPAACQAAPRNDFCTSGQLLWVWYYLRLLNKVAGT
jgi:hypothetical protein